jgi:pyruvate kinase
VTDRRRTKIVATVGPATRSLEALTALIGAGADVLRLNFSHGSGAEHAESVAMAREAAQRAGKQVAIIGDLPGPKVRLADVADGRIQLETGSEVVLTTDPGIGTAERLRLSWGGLPTAVRPGGQVFVADGKIRLRVADANEREVRCHVEVGGPVSSRQGLNLPGALHSPPAAGREDLDWVDFAIEHNFDLLAMSAVRRPEDLEPVERRVSNSGADIPVVAKIEKPEAAEGAEEIIKAVSAGVMVARGDLGIELEVEHVPAVQKRLLALAGRYAVPSITATQMLASMVASPRPTRAEVSDVANAIYQGTDAVMLSEETAVGDYAVEAIRVMDRIARATEPDLPFGDWVFSRVDDNTSDIANSVAGRPDPVGAHRAARLCPSPTGASSRCLAADRDCAPAQPAVRGPLCDR